MRVCGSEILVIKKASCGGQIIGYFRHTHGGVGREERRIDDLPMVRAVIESPWWWCWRCEVSKSACPATKKLAIGKWMELPLSRGVE